MFIDTLITEVAKYMKISIKEVEQWDLATICKIYAQKLDECEAEFRQAQELEKESEKIKRGSR